MRFRFGRRRYGRAKAAAVKYYRIISTKLGLTVLGYSSSGRVVNSINGTLSDSVSTMRAAARKHWPLAKDRTS